MKEGIKETALIILLAAVPLWTLGRHVARSRRPALEAETLRDSLAENADLDLAERHARLAEIGQSACGLCHLARHSDAMTPAWATGVAGSLLGIEAAFPNSAPSRVCLSCHDGTFARGDHAYTAHGGGHPIGVDYRLARASDPSAYNPAEGDSAIHLENGAVGCASCHQMHRLPRSVSRAGVRKAVCQSCHRL